MDLWQRTVYGVVLLLILGLAGMVLVQRVVEPGSWWLRIGTAVLLLGSAGSLWHDQRRGHFQRGRMGPATAVSFVGWTLLLLVSLLVHVPVSA